MCIFKHFLIVLLLAVTISSCRKKIEPGIKTTVTGTVFDYNKQKAIANVPIGIIEYERGFYGPLPKGVIDSTVSGIDGRYSITFSTTGQGVEYRIGFAPGTNYYTIQDAVGVRVGRDTTVNFWAIELHTLKARIQMVDNPNPPLRVSTITGTGARIYGMNNDTTVFLKIIPNVSNEIQFTITNKDTPTIYNYRVDTVNLAGFTDTFSKSFLVPPQTFPKRG
jgi:hypothetical protein